MIVFIAKKSGLSGLCNAVGYNMKHFSGIQVRTFLKSMVCVLLCALLLFGQAPWTPSLAEDSGVAFKGFNTENVTLTSVDWSTTDAIVTAGGVYMGGASSRAVYYINLTNIAASVDCGSLSVNFSVQAYINSEAEAELDEAGAKLYFRATENGEDLSFVSLPRGTQNPGDAVTLTSSAAIPAGTRFLFIELTGVQAGSSNTVHFDAPSLKINDDVAPTIASDYVGGWTNQNVSVTLTAADTQSGVEGIYKASDDTRVSATSQFIQTFTQNGTASYYAKDYSGRVSETLTITVTGIDKSAPSSAPSVSLSKSGWSNEEVTFTLGAVSQVGGESPQKRQYRLNGGAWTDYTAPVTVSAQGQTTIETRTLDEAGNASSLQSAIAYVDTVAPVVDTLTAQPHASGGATITFAASDATSGVAQRKWAQGTHTAADFVSGGTVLLSGTFEVTSGGVYTVFVKDNAGNTATSTVNVDTYPSITAIADQTVAEDGTLQVSFNVADEQTDASALTVQATSSDTALLPNPLVEKSGGLVTVTLTPAADRHGGPVTVNIAVTDGANNTATASFSVTVTSVNDAPVAVDDSSIVDEDGSVTLNVIANDTDADGDALTVSSAGSAANGTVTVSADKKYITYTPGTNFAGQDSFTYTVTDGQAFSTATVNLTLTEINDAPHAVNDTVLLEEDEARNIDVLGNDTDADLATTPDEVLTIQSVTVPAHGTAEIYNGKVLYTPNLNWSGSDSFSYTIVDRADVTSTATVSITVTSSNDAPVFADLDDTYTVDEDCGKQTVTFSISDVETNNASLMLQVVSGNEAKIPSSSLEISGLGDADPAVSLSYTPVKDANGYVAVTLRLGDGFTVTTQTVVVHITPQNDAPEAVNDAYTYTEDEDLLIDMSELVQNDFDIDGDTLSFAGVYAQPSHGTLTQQSGTDYRYTPEKDYSGNVTFTYSLTDGTVVSQGQVTLQGKAVNDAPTLELDAENVYVVLEDETLAGTSFTIFDLETTDVTSLIVTAGSSDQTLVSPSGLNVTIGEDGLCTLLVQPNSDQNGQAEIALTVSDGNLYTSKSFTLTVTAVADKPTALDDYVSVAKNGTITFSPLDNDTDVDGDAISITSFTQPEKGTVTLADGEFTYKDASPVAGIQTFAYTVSDGMLSATAAVYISVGGYSFPPSVTGVANQFINEDAQTAALPFFAADQDGDTFTVTASSSNPSLVPNNPSNLVLTDEGDGQYTISVVPAQNASGTAVITLRAEDSAGSATTVQFTVTVYPVNDVPQATDDVFSVGEDSSLAVNLLANDTDEETANEDLRVVSVTMPTHGRLTFENGVYTYTPYGNYNGSDSFSYTMTDGQTTAVATVALTIVPVNDAPHAYSIWRELGNTAEESVNINVLSSAYDVDGDTLYTYAVGTPRHGTAVIESDGTITYTRTEVSGEGNGADSFTYTVRDRSDSTGALTATATVYIGVNFEASAWTDDVWASADEDSAPFWISLDYGVPGGTSLLEAGTSPLGTVTALDAANKRMQFTPNENANGSTTISYTVRDASDNAKYDTATVHLTVYPVNDAPVFTVMPGAQTILEDGATAWLDVAFTDVDNTNLTLNAYVTNGDLQKPVLLTSGVAVDPTDANAAKIKLTPIANANGAAEIILQISDGMLSASKTFLLTVTAQNDAPEAFDISVEMPEDTSRVIEVKGLNSDVDGDTLTVTAGSPSFGSVKVNEDGTVTYTPNADFAGTDSFTYTLNDGNGGIGTATVTVTVQNVNDLPQIVSLPSQTQTPEDNALHLNFSVFDADVGDILIVSVDSVVAANGNLFSGDGVSITGTGANRTLSITPALNQYGTAEITVSVSDGKGGVTTQKVALTVNSVNDLPSALSDSFTISEDTAGNFDVLANDSDVEDATLRIVAVGKPAHGTASASFGKISYMPESNFFGTDTFTYTVSDGNNGQATATVTATVQSVNDAPNVKNDSASTQEDTSVTIDVLYNDSDVENDAIEVASTSGVTAGASVRMEDNKLVYTPPVDFFGTDTFSYTVTDNQSVNATSTATVTVKVTAVNDAPVITNGEAGTWTMDEDTEGEFDFNVSDAETAVANLIITLSSSDPLLVPNTSIAYTGTGTVKTAVIKSLLNVWGNCTISVTASDGENVTKVDFPLTINPVNDDPVLTVQNITTNEDIAKTLKAQAVDVDSHTLTYSLGISAEHGTVVVQPDGNYTYTPFSNYNGTDSFTVTVSDGDGGTNTKTVNVTVLSVNDAPVAQDDTAQAVDEDTPITIDVLANDTDIDGDTLTIVSNGFSANAHGTASANEGKVLFTPNANWNGSTSFTYTVRDGAGATDTATVYITVNPVNDDPYTTATGNDTYHFSEDCGQKTLDVLTNDDVDTTTNPLDEELTVTGVAAAPQHGSYSISGDSKTILYTPNENYFGADSLVYTMRDKAGKTGSFTVTINIASVNDLPTITAVSNQTIDEDGNTDVLSFTVWDVETAAASLTVTASSGNVTLVPNNAANLVVESGTGGARAIKVIPAANRNTDKDGTATITLTVKDANNATATTSFTLAVNKVNDAPSAKPDTRTTNENTAVTVDVLVNDDVDLAIEGDTLTIVEGSVSHASGSVLGSFAVINNKIVYTPYANWTSKVSASETLSYTARDAAGETSSSTVTITVTPVNDNPVLSAIADQTIDEDELGGTGAVAFTAMDEEDTTLTVTAVSSNQGLIKNSDISVVHVEDESYTVCAVPLADQNGEATITVTAADSQGGVATKTFKVTVTPVVDAPANGDDTYTVTEDTATVLNVLENDGVDQDTNPAATTFTIVAIETAPTRGTAQISADNKTITYTPAANNDQDDSFRYTMQNQTGQQSTFTVGIDMVPVNDAPQFQSAIAKQTVGESTTIGPISFVVGDVDDAEETLILSAASSNQVLVPNANITLTGPDATGNCTVTVQPSGKWNGTSTITLSLKDTHNASGAPLTFVVSVTEVNDPPVANADTYETDEDVAKKLTPLDNDTDPDTANNPYNTTQEVLTIVSVGTVSHAVVSITDSGKSLQFTPDSNWNGNITFTYTIRDVAGVERTASINLKVKAKNDAPVTGNDTATTDEDVSAVVDVLANDSDVDTDALLNTDADYSPASEHIFVKPNGFAGVEHGTASVDEDGNVVFAPEADWNGTEAFTYTLVDPSGAEATGTVTVTVVQQNDAPVAVNDTKQTIEDTAVTIDVLENDTDQDNVPSLNENPQLETIGIVESSITEPLNGTVALVSGKIVYTPDENFNGSDNFTYCIQDAAGVQSAAATVTVTVNAQNDAPVAANDTAQTNEDSAVTIDALANDADVDQGDTLSLVSVSIPDHGTASLSNGKIIYTPPANWNGTAHFSYTMRDAANAFSSANVTVSVNFVNDAPVAGDDVASTTEGTAVEIDALQNDTDVDMDLDLNSDPDAHPEAKTLSVLPNGFSGLDNGTASVNEQGQIVFTPNANWNGMEVFSYTVTDGLLTDTGTVTVTVNAVNNLPVAINDAAQTDEDISVTVDVLENDTDADIAVEGDSLRVVSAGDAQHGTVTVAQDELSVTYAPAKDYNGVDTFTYTIEDEKGGRASALVSVTVNAMNDAPEAKDDAFSTAEDTAVTLTPLENDLDSDLSREGDSLIILSLAGVEHGTAAVSANGQSIVFTPAENWNGETSFTYTMEDKAHETSSATVTLTVAAVNDAPTAPQLLTPLATDYYKDGQTIEVTWNASTDVEKDELTYTLSFFDGSTWQVLASGLTEISYSHPLTETQLSTNLVCYKVTVTDGAAEAFDTGDNFIIDNKAPEGVTAQGKKTGTGGTFSVSGGTDLLPFEYEYSLDETVWKPISAGETVTVEKTLVYYRAVDVLGNTFAASLELKAEEAPRDTLPPAQPNIVLSPTVPTNQSVLISFALLPDPGGSGNATVRLPDGSMIPAVGGVQWTAMQNGVYAFVLTDNAGNSRTVSVSVQNIDKIPPTISVNNHGYAYGTLTKETIRVTLSFRDEGLGIASSTYSVGGGEQNYAGEIVFGEDGSYYIRAVATDLAGNRTEALFGPYRVDTSAPEFAVEVENITTQGGELKLELPEDASIVRVYKPDGTMQEFPAEGFVFTATKSGEYTIEIVDAAGNVTTQTITVTIPDEDVPVGAPQTPAPTDAPPQPTATAEPVEDTQVEKAPLNQNAVLGAACAAGLMLLLLLVWFNRPIRIVYTANDGERKEIRVKKRFGKVPKKEGVLELDLSLAEAAAKADGIELTFKKRFAERMREREVCVLFYGKEVLRALVPKDHKGEWSAIFKL